MHAKETQVVLEKKQYETQMFATKYGLPVINYFIGILKQENMLGDCPVMQTMLQEFANKDLVSEEVFQICAAFRRSFTNILFQHQLSSQENIEQLHYMLDQNFAGVIRTYDYIKYDTSKKLLQEKQFFNEYVDAINFSSIVSKTDPSGKITYINKLFEEISGYTADELIGKPHNMVRHPDMDSSVFEQMWSDLKKQKKFHAIIKNKHKNGSSYYVKSFIVPIIDTNGKTTEYISIRQDVTELIKTIEKEHALNTMKDDFLRNITHEIKTPLNHIVSSAELLRKKLNDEKLLRHIDMMLEGSSQLQSIVEHILDLSLVTSGSYELKIDKNNIFEHFTALLNSEKQSAQNHNLVLKFFIDTVLDKEFECDINLLEKILKQLLSNAIKFNVQNGTIAVRISQKDNALIIEVKDNGIGIEKEYMQDIFEPFFQIDASSTRSHEGLGVGLALVKKSVKYLNGDIKVASEKSIGTLFKVIIPLSEK